MIIAQTKKGQRVSLLSMTGTYKGTVDISRSAKNYCDGQSSIKLTPAVMGLIEWDEAPGRVVTISAQDFGLCSPL